MKCTNCGNPLPSVNAVCEGCGSEFDPLDWPDAE